MKQDHDLTPVFVGIVIILAALYITAHVIAAGVRAFGALWGVA